RSNCAKAWSIALKQKQNQSAKPRFFAALMTNHVATVAAFPLLSRFPSQLAGKGTIKSPLSFHLSSPFPLSLFLEREREGKERRAGILPFPIFLVPSPAPFYETHKIQPE